MMPGTFLRHTGVGLEGGLRYEPKVAMADGFLSAVQMGASHVLNKGLGISPEACKARAENL